MTAHRPFQRKSTRWLVPVGMMTPPLIVAAWHHNLILVILFTLILDTCVAVAVTVALTENADGSLRT